MRKLSQWFSVLVVLFVATAAGCGSQPAGSSPSVSSDAIIAEDAWVRTTDGKSDPSMTSLFVTLVNPGDNDIQLVSAECDDAGMVELHETVDQDGKKVMQKVEAIDVPPNSHTHLKSGGDHIMLMNLHKELPVGAEVTVTLTFSTGQSVTVTASAKNLTEEPEHYHPSGSGTSMPSASPTA